MAQQQKREVVELTTFQEYKNFVATRTVVILKASATWCGPCQTIKPHFINKVNELPLGVSVILIDISKAPSISRKLSIRSVPCMISIIRGQPCDVVMGANIDGINSFFGKIQKLLGQ